MMRRWFAIVVQAAALSWMIGGDGQAEAADTTGEGRTSCLRVTKPRFRLREEYCGVPRSPQRAGLG